MCTWKAIWLSVLIAASLPFICFCLPSIHTCLQYFISRYLSVVSQLRFQNLWERFFLLQCLCLIWQCKCCSKCILLTLSFLLLINIFLFLISAMAGWRYIPNTCAIFLSLYISKNLRAQFDGKQTNFILFSCHKW